MLSFDLSLAFLQIAEKKTSQHSVILNSVYRQKIFKLLIWHQGVTTNSLPLLRVFNLKCYKRTGPATFSQSLFRLKPLLSELLVLRIYQVISSNYLRETQPSAFHDVTHVQTTLRNVSSRNKIVIPHLTTIHLFVATSDPRPSKRKTGRFVGKLLHSEGRAKF